MTRRDVRKTQPQQKHHLKADSFDRFYAANTFAGLPYDIKYHFLRECHFSPSELLCLSRINRSWRECATSDALWNPWLEVIPKDLQVDLRLIKNVFRRDLVMLGLTTKCKGCGAWAGTISAPLMLRLCHKCLVDNPVYGCVDENTRKLLFHSDTYGLDANGEKIPKVHSWKYVSEQSLIDAAIQKHGGTLDLMKAHTAATHLRAKQEHARKVAIFEEERDAALAQNLPFRKHTPRNGYELSWSINYNNESAPMNSSLPIGSLFYKDGKMHHSESYSCKLCHAELVELYRVEHGVHLPSLQHPTGSQKRDRFRTTIGCVPEGREDYDSLDFDHYFNHLEAVAWKAACPTDCKTAASLTGEGTCEFCCKERALKKQLGDQTFNQEMADIWDF